MAGLWRQMKWLVYRNVLIKIRYQSLLFQEVFIPLCFILNLATFRYTQQVDPIPAIPSSQLQSWDLFTTPGFLPALDRPLAFTPDTAETQNIMQGLASDLNITASPPVIGFSSEEMILHQVANETANFSAAVVFNDDFPLNLTYKMRMPYGGVPLSHDLFTYGDSCYRAEPAYGIPYAQCPITQYLYSGFSAIQALLEHNIVKEVTGNSSLLKPNILVEMLPKERHLYSTISLQMSCAAYMVLAYMPFVGVLMTYLVYEKEKKVKECMKIMGLNNVAYWFSWMVVYSVILTAAGLLIVGYCKIITLFPAGNFFLIFLVMFLFGLSLVTLAFMLSPLVQKATTAGALGFFILIFMVIPYIPLGLSGTTIPAIPPAVFWVLCLLSPVALALAIDRAILFEFTQGGLQFSNLGVGDFPVYGCIVMLCVDIILYLLLALYFEQVMPGGYGQKRSALFFLSPSFWCGKKSRDPTDTTGLLENGIQAEIINHGEDIEPVPPALRGRDGIRINDIRKVFPGQRGLPDVKAVDGISLDIYEGQITCLLGHNGAGKSTLISCLTGMQPATSGSATIYGHSVRDVTELNKIHNMTGICLQENTIFEVLSPEEHLRLYAGLKGVPEEDFDKEVEETLTDIDLVSQRATYAKELSGGQKRKLCVGMALIGKPKVLFLDEPSSGMDPYSRRQMWSLLKKQREGRVTLLTTHFMDEADILADRKAIVSKGQLRCCGSSLFLKNKFGLGYHLSMVVEPDCDRDKITSHVQTHVPAALVSRSHGMELSFRLPLKDVSQFAGMFKSLEESDDAESDHTASKALGIQTYGVSMTTLEEVFLKIGEEAEVDEEDNDGADTEPLLPSSPTINSQPSKKLEVPTAAAAGMNIDDSASNNSHSAVVNLEQSPLDSTILATKPIEIDYKNKMKSLGYVEVLLALRSPATYIMRLALPIMMMIGGSVVAVLVDFGSTSGSEEAPTPLWLNPSMYLKDNLTSTQDGTTSFLYKDSLPPDQSIVDFEGQLDRLGIASEPVTNFSSVSSIAPHNGAVDMMNLGSLLSASQYTAYFNDTAQHSLPVITSVLSNALLGLYGNDTDPLVIMAASHQFPQTASQPTYGFTSGIIFVFLFGMGLSWALIGYPIDKVKERQLKIKAQLRIAGVDTLNYWGSVFVIDAAQMALIAVIGLIIIGACQVDSLITGGAMFSLIITLILYIPAAVLHSYCVSFLFDNFETAQGYASFFFIHIPLLLFVPIPTMDILVPGPGAGLVHLALCLLYPIYSIFGTLYFIDKVYQRAAILQQLDQLSFGTYYEPDNFIWPSMIMILLSNILLIFFLRFLEIVKTGGRVKDTCPCLVDGKIGVVKENLDMIPEEDSDVKNERVVVEEIFNQDKPSAVSIQGLRREFVKRTNQGCCDSNPEETTKVAVRNLSLSVSTGEVLGLLGPNGAGKTTTMNVVTADCEPTRGQVRVGGYDVASALSHVYQAMGYCPQIDPLWGEITAREHLEAFAAFKGIHVDDRKHIADHYMTCLNIMEHADKRAKELSGGTKRKLCFALSMLGDPQIVLLDEPSTGMDPSSKRFLWNTITSSFIDKRGAILTTHSMEEADAVCSRVGIMISGQLKCLGTTQHLKDKYGGGYILEIKLNPGALYYVADQTNTDMTDLLDQKVEALHQHILTILPKAEVIESFAERITYKIPRDGVVSLSSVFSLLEQGKQEYDIEEYSFSQTTLEQVFIEFAKAQYEDEIAENNAHVVTNSARPGSRHSVRHGPKPQIEV